MRTQRSVRIAPALVAIALVLGACGGSDPVADDGDSDDADATTTATAAVEDSGGTTEAPESGGGDSGSDGGTSGGQNVAIVTVGDTTWEFDANPDGPITDCDPDFFGSFWVIGEAADGTSLNLLLPPTDGAGGDPGSIRIADRSTEADWTADPTLRDTTPDYADIVAEGDSQVDSYTIDGTNASGTATFVDENQIFAVIGGTLDEVDVVTGSFEVSCAG